MTMQLALSILVIIFLVPILAASESASNSPCDSPAATPSPIVLPLTNASIASQGVSAYGIRIDVGGQSIIGTPSTVVDNTLLIASNICGDQELQNYSKAQCRAYHGGLFDLTAASGFQNVSLASANLPTDEGWKKFNPAYKNAIAADLGLPGSSVLHNTTMIALTEGFRFSAGHIGLGRSSSLLNRLKDSGSIASLSFGIDAGSQSAENPRDGSLVLGGYDSARVASPFVRFPMNYTDMLYGRYCPLQAAVEALALLVDGQQPIELLAVGEGHQICLEPYDTLFRITSTRVAEFKAHTGWSENITYPDDLFVGEKGLLYPAPGISFSLRFTLNNGFEVVVPNSELQQPLRGLSKEGRYVTNESVVMANIFEEDTQSAWVLGRALLSQVYLAVDYEANIFQLANALQTHDIAPSPVQFASATNASCKGSRLSGGSIAAVVLGVVLGLIGIGGPLYYAYRRRKRHQQAAGDEKKGSASTEERPPIGDVGLTNGSNTRHEMPSDRRCSELGHPNGGHPPPSPHPPYTWPTPLHAETQAPVTTPSDGRSPTEPPQSPGSAVSPTELEARTIK